MLYYFIKFNFSIFESNNFYFTWCKEKECPIDKSRVSVIKAFRLRFNDKFDLWSLSCTRTVTRISPKNAPLVTWSQFICHHMQLVFRVPKFPWKLSLECKCVVKKC